ncbi:methanogenesis marker protein 1 [Methanothermus fervidus DSM 2088]|uniref:Methanogenesis marker protein 1 n=1 Tax=Methanothermus fervidus (strain ATCC 43054 / DSM 2088 / JCM 10308 / V24 S) TaxID=523846 RepID=E3GYA0_METFV|nr:YcaO-related McrA-glycine thioamidation protein [Methanothermus fervidus]ADP77282.1 methanogenesis marker protein 1 [Methanothermus fervidus DSM 2088]
MIHELHVEYKETSYRIVSPSKTIEYTKDKVKEIGVKKIKNITNIDRVGIPVFLAFRSGVKKGAINVYKGKGVTKEQAKASVIMEAIERYSAEMRSNDNTIISTTEELERCIDPNELILPGRISPDSKLEWCAALNLRNNKKYYVPANAVYHPYNPRKNSVRLFRSNTNGLASGNVIEEAILHGIFEVIERDAWSLFEIRRRGAKKIDCSNVENEMIENLLNKFKKAKIDIKLLDITSDIKVHTVAAVADDIHLKDPRLLTIGFGSHLDPEIAVMRALTEVAQSRATEIYGVEESKMRKMFVERIGYERMKRINYHWFREPEDVIGIEELKNEASNNLKKNIEIVLQKLKKRGFKDVFIVNLTREIGVPVVRVIIPGLELSTVDPERVGQRAKSGAFNAG